MKTSTDGSPAERSKTHLPPSSGRRRVWIVNHYADAPDRANGTRHFDLARRLVAAGGEVTIFASGFSHVTGREERLGPTRLFRTDRFDGVRFVWLRTTPYRGNGWRRQVNMLSFMLVFLIVQTRERRPDAIIGSTVHPFAALGAWVASRLRHADYLFEIRDLWPQTLVDMDALRIGSLVERSLRLIEAFLVRRASVVITLLPGIREYLRDRNLPTDRVLYVPNGVDLESFDRAAGDPAAVSGEARECLRTIEALRATGRLVFGYVGAFGRVNDVTTIVAAAAIAEARSPGTVAVLLMGDGPERPAIEHAAAAVPNVTIVKPVAKRVVPVVLEALDAGIVHATATPVYRYGISFNKLFEYLAAGRPVVFACISAYDPVADAGAGITVPPGDPTAIADAFLAIASLDDAGRSRLGSAGREYVARRHDIKSLALLLAGPTGLDLDDAL